MRICDRRVGLAWGLGLAAAICPSAAHAVLAYSTGFEDFALGPIDPAVGPTQGGWSGGALPGFVNNNVGDEQIVNTQANTGSQSWHFARGYGSPGAGTPFTPSLSTAVTNVGDVFSGTLSFKAHTAGDGSGLSIDTGNLAGNDRAEILARISNGSGGLSVNTYNFSDGAGSFSIVPVATGLDTGAWHSLSFSLTKTATGNQVSLSVNGGPTVTVEAYLAEWRDVNSFAYSESARLKFQPTVADSAAFNGFYIDDISYSVAAIPEASSFAFGSLMYMVGTMAYRRRPAQSIDG
jgi:hypothetical protein